MLLDQFAAKFGAGAPVVYELFSDDVLRRANQMSFGFAQLPTFDLTNAHFVIGFGADFLGTWNAPVAHSAALRPHAAAAGPACAARSSRSNRG